MNRIYRLVWNRSLRLPQVASELARSSSRVSGAGTVSIAPRLRPLVLAMGLAMVSSAAWGACGTGDVPSCSAAGGAGITQRTGGGGAGNGSGGGASVFNGGTGNTDQVVGSPAAANGTGGAGAAGASAGGSGGSVGTSGGGVLDITTTTAGGSGAAGADGFNFSSGGGGGGAGVSFTGTQLNVQAGGTAVGGAGGVGGNGTSGDQSNGAGGGGGGAGVLASSNFADIQIAGQIIGGAGGAGGGGGNNGGGGAGGDGLLVLGHDTSATNSGTVTGGAGAAAGTSTFDHSAQGGTGGTGVNLVGLNATLQNDGSITGGAGAVGGQGGVGVMTWGGNTVVNGPDGIISGGLNSDGSTALAIQFHGTDNALAVFNGGQIIGGIDLASGATAVVRGQSPGIALDNAITLGAGSTITGDVGIAGADGLEFSGVVSGSGALAVTGPGTMTLTGNDTYTGGTSIDNGSTLQIGNGGTTGSIVGDVHNQGTLAFNRSNTVSLGGVIDGSGNLEQNGSGTLVLSGVNTYTGSTTINAGTLALSGNGSIAASSGVAVNGTFDISGTNSGASVQAISGAGDIVLGAKTLTLTNASGSFDGVIAGSGGLTISGGSQTLSAAQAYTGTTDIGSGATLALSGAGSIAGSQLVTADGTFDISGTTAGANITSLSGGGSVVLGAQGLNLTQANALFSGVISGSGDVTVAGGTETFSGVNTYTGQTSIDAGATLALTGSGSIASSSGVVDNGTFDIQNTTGTAAITALSGNGSVLLGAKYLAVTNATGTFGGNISGSGGLTIDGGTQILSGANAYTGLTTVSNGATLALTGSGSIAASAGLLLNGGTFDIAGTSNGASVQLLAGNGNVTLGAQTLTLTNGSGTYFGVLSGTGGLTVSGGAQTLAGVQAYTGATAIGSGATLSLSGLGSIASSSGVANDGIFDISGTTGGASIKALTGSGTVALGAQNLTLTQASGTFGGVIGGTGGVEIAAGTQTLSGANTYAGVTSIDSGATLALSGAGGIASSSNVSNSGTFDISGTNAGASVQQLSGNGAVALGAQTLTVTNAASAFDGVISGTGGFSVTGGSQFLSGVNTYTGATTIGSGGALALSGNGSIAASSGVMADGLFDITGATNGASITSLRGGSSGQVNLGVHTLTVTQAAGDFGGSMTGAGNLVVANGTQTLSGNNTYTGATTIQQGATLALAGTGSIAASSGVANSGVFDIAGTTAGASIKALSGNGAVNLGAQTLTITNASGTYDGVFGGAGGGLSIAGGSQTLTGVQTYTGATTVAGTLALQGSGSVAASSGVAIANGTFDISGTSAGASIQALSGNGAVNLGAQTLTLTNANGAYDGVLSGTGGLSIAGGSQVLTGVQTYTGATSIAGTLALQGNGSVAASSGVAIANGTFDISGTSAGASIKALSGNGAVNLGAQTLTVTNASGTYDGVLSGTGGLSIAGGSQTLTAAQTYTGATNIAGTLALQGNGSVAASSGVTLANGTFDISATNAGTSIAGLAGTGSVNIGGQPLTITQANGSFGGVISGAGGLTLSAGTQTLTGANTYTGATTINGGTLALAGGGSLVPASAISLNGSGATFDISAAGAQTVATLGGVTGSRVALGANTLNLSSGTFAGSFTGTGVLNKQDATVFTVNGDSSAFAGKTNVNAGTLAVGDASSPNAVLGGDVAVGAQGKLQGHGSIGGSVTNNGIVAPGGSIGTLTVAGNYAQAAGATLAIEVSPTDASLLKVGGNASLGGTLALTYDPGTYTAHQYTILTAGGSVSGTFGNVTNTYASGAALGTLTPAVTYGANQVGLSLAAPTGPGTPSGPTVIAPTQTSNYAALGTAALLRAQSANASLVERGVLDDPSRKGDGLWVTAAGAGTDIQGRSGQPGFHMDQYGLMMGVDRPVGDATVGVAAGFSHSNLRENVTGDTAQTDTVRLALYGAQPLGAVRLSGTVGYAFDDLSQKRNFAGIGVAEGDHVGHEFTAALQAAMPIAVGGGTLTPSIGARYAYFHGNAFGEDGARGQNLRVGVDSARSLQPYVGLKFDQSFDHDGKPLDLQLRAGYATETAGRHRGVTVAAQDGTLFAAPGTDLPRSYATLGASVTMHPTRASTLSLSYDALLNVGHASAQAASVTFSYRF